MPFENDKKVFLGKQDKSKKGEVDREIKTLVGIINRKEDYYTTSSCAGRIVLLRKDESGRKDRAEWLFASHNKITFNQLKKPLKRIPQDIVWLLQEGAILHVRCRAFDDAVRLLNAARQAGFKHAGICSFGSKITVEITDTERIDMPIAENKKLFADDNYLKFLAKEANRKLAKTRMKIKKLEKSVKKI